MTTTITRRGILKALGIGAAALAAEPILEPVRKLWFVGSNAPVGSRIERTWHMVNGSTIEFAEDDDRPTPAIDAYIARTWSMKIDVPDEGFYDPQYQDAIAAARRLKKAMWAQQERDVADHVHALERAYGQARGGEKVGYLDDLEVAGPGAWRIDSTEPMHDGNVRLLVRQQAEAYAQRDMALAGKYVMTYAKKS